jgi:ERCC4-type nuclease
MRSEDASITIRIYKAMKETPYSESPKFLKPYVLKPTVIPDGLILLQDTREQRPLFSRIPKGLTVCSTTLHDGDYSIKGFESQICFERKSSDLWAYCSSEREKTIAKMERFKSFEFVGLIIEGRESDIYQFQQHTKVHPECIRGALTSFQIRYGVHVYIGSRDNCARWLLDCCVKFWNVKHQV